MKTEFIFYFSKNFQQKIGRNISIGCKNEDNKKYNYDDEDDNYDEDDDEDGGTGGGGGSQPQFSDDDCVYEEEYDKKYIYFSFLAKLLVKIKYELGFYSFLLFIIEIRFNI
jgi:hypothetical protein